MSVTTLLNPACIRLISCPADKQTAISEAIALLEPAGVLTDAAAFARDVLEREASFTTALGGGIGLPHARSSAVTRPALAVLGIPGGVDFEALDEQPVRLIFLMAAPLQASAEHLQILSSLATLLDNADLRHTLCECRDVQQFIALLAAAESCHNQEASAQPGIEPGPDSRLASPAATYDIVAVTACPAGLSHTYLAAEALERCARTHGASIKVEACGAAGTRNPLHPQDIARARAVIVAADRDVDMDRFTGKLLIRVGVAEGVHHPERLIQRALHGDGQIYNPGGGTQEPSSPIRRAYRHLMSGLSNILPLVSVAGILAAVADLRPVSSAELGGLLAAVSDNVSSLILPILSACIAFSIAGRVGLTAGLSGGVMASVAAAGVWGAVVNGFIGGYIALAATVVLQRVLKGHDALTALLLYPLLGALLTALCAEFVTDFPLAVLDEVLMRFITGASIWELMLIGALAGGMMAADMGGPFNKLAYAVGVFLLADSFPNGLYSSAVMAAVMIGGMIPPLAMSGAVLCARRHFTAAERRLAWRAALGGLLFITEQVLPFLSHHPHLLRIACIIGSAVGGACSMLAGVRVCAPHGGVLIAPLSNEPLYFMLALIMGAVAGALGVVVVRLRLWSPTGQVRS